VRPLRLGLLAAIAFVLVLTTMGPARAQTEDESGAEAPDGGRIEVVQVNGLIDPANADLIRTSIKNAERDGATAVVFQMDASGAVDVDMNQLHDEFTNAKVPVTVWVGPSGGGARGAAALLARSADYAAVASGAKLGAVDPIRYDDPDFTMDVPLKNVDAEANTLLEFIGSLEQPPLNLKTMKVVELDGRPTRQPAGEVHFHKLTLGAQLAHTLDAPWVAYFLFVVGLALIVFEFFTAGVGIAGAVGAVSLLGGCFGFSHLPVQPWAIALLVIGVFGMAIDVQAGGLGAWTFIGGIALVIGSIFLYGGSSRLDPTWWVLLLVIGGTVVFMLSGMTAMIRSRFSTPTIGREELVGELGEAAADVAPDGVVRIREALWKARTNRATPIHAGDTVRVVSIEGLTLEVEPESGGAIDYRERRRRS
jgi:membrane-bound serine protease (ClpP class)